MITDAQVHLWEANRADRPWAADGKPPLPEPMTGERMLAMMNAAGVDRAIISPLMLPDWAPDYAFDVAARYPSRFRVMGWYWPEKHERHDALARWLGDPHLAALSAFCGPTRTQQLHADQQRRHTASNETEAVAAGAVEQR